MEFSFAAAGLGTSTKDEAIEYFSDLGRHRKEFLWQGKLPAAVVLHTPCDVAFVACMLHLACIWFDLNVTVAAIKRHLDDLVLLSEIPTAITSILCLASGLRSCQWHCRFTVPAACAITVHAMLPVYMRCCTLAIAALPVSSIGTALNSLSDACCHDAQHRLKARIGHQLCS